MSSCNMLKRSRYNSVLSRSFVSNKLVLTKPSYLPDISDEDLLAIGEAYPDDPTQVRLYSCCHPTSNLVVSRDHHSIRVS